MNANNNNNNNSSEKKHHTRGRKISLESGYDSSEDANSSTTLTPSESLETIPALVETPQTPPATSRRRGRKSKKIKEEAKLEITIQPVDVPLLPTAPMVIESPVMPLESLMDTSMGMDLISGSEPIIIPVGTAPAGDINCEECTRGDDEEQLILCDKCDRGYHLYCLPQQLMDVPVGQWFCYKCAEPENKAETEGTPSKTPRKRGRKKREKLNL